MCSYFEYIVKKSKRLEDLPVSVSKLYDEVLNIFTTNHIEKKIPNFIRRENTLDMLSKFAADSLLKGMYLFEEDRGGSRGRVPGVRPPHPRREPAGF